ncbi:hypothetical protein ACFL08_04020 [Patescibacteria group bacterium]
MKIRIREVRENPINVLRRAGYSFQHHTDKGEMSFIRPLASAGFPRFHMYAKLEDTNLMISIHLDQKKGTYGESTRHHGEYGNEGALKEEVQRIAAAV